MHYTATDAHVKKAVKRLQLFFPDQVYTEESVADLMNDDEVFLDLATTLKYVQSALLDEKVMEVRLDTTPRTFFTRITDFPPENEEDRVSYKENSYLENLAYVVILPVEPGIGNHILKHSKCVIIRIFTTLYAIELGTTFQDMVHIDNVPMLRLDFPSIGRIVRDAREYRAKAPEAMELKLIVQPGKKRPQLECDVHDVSNSGISFIVSRESYKTLKLDDSITMRIYLDKKLLVTVNGTIRHLTKMRLGSAMQFLCGVQLDLESRRIATAIESLVARVQRAHLQEVSQIYEDTGVEIIA